MALKPTLSLIGSSDDGLVEYDQIGGDFRHSSVLLYGKDLAGKTTTAAQLAAYLGGRTKTYIISAEGGTRAISGRIAEVSTKQHFDLAMKRALSGDYTDGAVVVDTVDRVYGYALEAAAAGEIEHPLGPPLMRDKDTGAVSDGRLREPRWIYQVANYWLIEHLRALHAAPFLTVFTAHAKEVALSKDKSSGLVTKAETRIDLSPAMLKLVRDALDVVLYLYRTAEGQRRFFADSVVTQTNSYYAKDRFGVFATDGKYSPLDLSAQLIAERLSLPIEFADVTVPELRSAA